MFGTMKIENSSGIGRDKNHVALLSMVARYRRNNIPLSKQNVYVTLTNIPVRYVRFN